MKRLLVMVLLLASGCASARQQRWHAANDAVAAAIEECRQQRVAGELKSYTASVECSNPRVVATYQAAGYPHMDLIHLVAAYRLALAERADRGELTEAAMRAHFLELMTKVESEAQRRNQTAAQTAAQQSMAYGALLS